MSTLAKSKSINPRTTVSDLLRGLGGVPARRVRLVPTPGTASERDVLEIERRENRLFELVDGALVEKVMGVEESMLGMLLAQRLFEYPGLNELGRLLGADGMMRTLPGRIRIPDLAFITWRRWAESRKRRAPISPVAPDLVVEILSKGNTRGEMKLKLSEYFRAGVRLVWLIDPRKRTVHVHESVKSFRALGELDRLDGGAVSPGLSIALKELFDDAERTGPR